jgi:hypothetical protein
MQQNGGEKVGLKKRYRVSLHIHTSMCRKWRENSKETAGEEFSLLSFMGRLYFATVKFRQITSVIWARGSFLLKGARSASTFSFENLKYPISSWGRKSDAEKTEKAVMKRLSEKDYFPRPIYGCIIQPFVGKNSNGK